MALKESRTLSGSKGRAPGYEEPPSNVTRKSGVLASTEDGLNRVIIRMLQEDGRAPFKKIAASLNVSEGTIRNRFNRMKDAGHLRVVALADPVAINYRADAMLGIKVGLKHTPQQVAERLSQHSAVVYVLWVSGRYDLLVEVVFETRRAFLQFLEEQCYGRADIAELEVMTGLEVYKNQFLLKRGFD